MYVSIKVVKECLSRFVDSFDTEANDICMGFINGSFGRDDACKRLENRFYLFSGRLYGVDNLLWLLHSDIQELVSSHNSALKALFHHHYDRITAVSIQRIADSTYSPVFGSDSEATESVLVSDLPAVVSVFSDEMDSKPDKPREVGVPVVECPLCSGTGSQGEFADYRECNYCAGSGFSPDPEILSLCPITSINSDVKGYYFQNITFISGWIKRHSSSFKTRLPISSRFRSFSFLKLKTRVLRYV